MRRVREERDGREEREGKRGRGREGGKRILGSVLTRSANRTVVGLVSQICSCKVL